MTHLKGFCVRRAYARVGRLDLSHGWTENEVCGLQCLSILLFGDGFQEKNGRTLIFTMFTLKVTTFFLNLHKPSM